MKIYEIGTGYTSIPAKISAATEIVVEELTKSMLNQNINVNIIDIKDINRKKNILPIIEVDMPRKFNKTDVQLGILHKLKRIIYSIQLAKKLNKILKLEKQKVILHFHNQYNLYFFLHLTSKKVRKKSLIVYTNHSGIWSLNWNKIHRIVKRKYFQESYCMKKADLVFVLNSDTHKNIMKYLKIDENHIVDISNGVNPEIYKPMNDKELKKEKISNELLNKTIFLQVGSIYENKGQLRSIKQLEPYLEKNKNAIFLFAGGIVSQTYYQEILDEVKKKKLENQVKYIGMISPGKNLCTLYNLATATIMSSEYEGFSLVVIESLACGVPVLLENNKMNFYGDGIIHCNQNINKTIDEKILNDNNIKNKCRNNVLNNYSWDVIAKKYLEEFQKLDRS